VFKIAIWSAVVSVVLIGGAYAVWRYIDYRTTRENEAQQEAEERTQQHRVQACLNRLKAGSGDAFDLVAAQQTCESNPDSAPTPARSFTPVAEPCWSKPDVKGLQIDLNNLESTDGRPISPDPNEVCYPLRPKKTINTKVKHLIAKFDADLTTTELGSLTCAQVKKGESVVLLVDDSSWVKVKTLDGHVCWGSGLFFQIE
jgi:hypothetical protein